MSEITPYFWRDADGDPPCWTNAFVVVEDEWARRRNEERPV